MLLSTTIEWRLRPPNGSWSEFDVRYLPPRIRKANVKSRAAFSIVNIWVGSARTSSRPPAWAAEAEAAWAAVVAAVERPQPEAWVAVEALPALVAVVARLA